MTLFSRPNETRNSNYTEPEYWWKEKNEYSGEQPKEKNASLLVWQLIADLGAWKIQWLNMNECVRNWNFAIFCNTETEQHEI